MMTVSYGLLRFLISHDGISHAPETEIADYAQLWYLYIQSGDDTLVIHGFVCFLVLF